MVFQAKEERTALEKKIVQLENELSSTTSQLENSNNRLEEREKALQNVSRCTLRDCVHDSLYSELGVLLK